MKTKKKNLLFPIIKKGFILLSFILLILTSFSFVKAEELENYDIQFYDNIHFQLENGVYEVNSSWASTNKIMVKNGDIVPVLPYCHYIQFYNSMNIYIGYYVVDGTDNSHSTYLGLFGGGAITLTGVKSFVLSINKDDVDTYINNYYGPELTDKTFEQVFTNPSYGDYTDDFLGDTLDNIFSSNDEILQTPLRLCDTNEDEVADGWGYYFSNTSVDFIENYDYWEITVSVEEEAAGFVSYTGFNFIAGHKYFVYIDVSAGDSALTIEFGGVSEIGVDGEYYTIFTPVITEVGYINIYPTTPVQDDYYNLYQFVVFDLTELYGAGSEPTAVWFNANVFDTTEFDYTFGYTTYAIDNLNADKDTAILAEAVAPYGVPTYDLTRVLPTNLIINGDFVSNTTGWFGYGGSLSWDNGRAKIIGDGSYGQPFIYRQTGVNTTISGHNYYISADIETNTTGSELKIYNSTTGHPTASISSFNINIIYKISAIDNTTDTTPLIRVIHSPVTANNSVLYADNLILYDVSALKTAGLFGGMSGAQIKSVLDDYSQNGLTASNIGYFFTDGGTFDTLSITDKNTILSYYGLDFIGGDVVDFTEVQKLRFYNTDEEERSIDNLIVVLPYVYEKQNFINLTNEEVRAFINSNSNSEDYDNNSFFQTIDVIDGSRWLFRTINESIYKQYYINLYYDSILETERWEWYYWAGVTSLNYDKLLAVYQTLQTIIPISFTDFQTNEVFFYVVPSEEPEDLAPTIDDTLTDIGLSTTLKVIIGLGIIASLFGFIAIKRGNWLYYPLIGYPAFIVFALLGWFAWWLALAFASILTLVLYFIVFK